jgi:3-oxoacyl-[acyl-carrier protein] reductase
LSKEQKHAYLDMVPLRRFGSPEDVANAVLFIASTEAAYITGSSVEVTGGL